MKVIYQSETIIEPKPIPTLYIIGYDLLSNFHQLDPLKRKHYSQFLLLIDRSVDRLYGKKIKASLKRVGKPIITSIAEPGEESKDLNILTKIIKPFFDKGFDRSSLLISVGGGVISDIGGFLGSILMRGIDSVLVPTSLLSQVDAAIGGKTAVNLTIDRQKMLKNMLGTFNYPLAVVSDIDVLYSLPKREIKSGLGEAVKYFLISGKPESNKLLKIIKMAKKDKKLLTEVVFRCQKIKKDIIERDPFDCLGLREKLNLGHTIGHAIEGQADGLSHGEAVILGIVAVAKLSFEMNMLSKRKYEQIITLIRKLKFNIKVSNISKMKLAKAINFDKKAGRFVLIGDIGRVETGIYPPKHLIQRVINDLIIR